MIGDVEVDNLKGVMDVSRGHSSLPHDPDENAVMVRQSIRNDKPVLDVLQTVFCYLSIVKRVSWPDAFPGSP